MGFSVSGVVRCGSLWVPDEFVFVLKSVLGFGVRLQVVELTPLWDKQRQVPLRRMGTGEYGFSVVIYVRIFVV